LGIAGPKDWPVLSTLDPGGKGPYTAANFYALADSQILMGPRFRVQRIEGTVPLFVAVYSEGEVDAARVGRLASEALERMIAWFGSAPFPHYTVHLELLTPLSEQNRYGFSMEHLDSGTFYLARDQGVADDGRTRYNFAHHMAHAWIPKRSYGEGYYPFTWELAPLLDTIWLSEGFAQYAAVQALAAALPVGERSAYRERLLEARFRRNLAEAPPFLRRMSLVELSRVASTRYSEDFRTGRLVFSRGALMAAEMDDSIDRETAGPARQGLRDALRALVVWSARHKRAFRIEELPAIFREATGVDTREILERWLKPLE
jgi:predicted metalloprotease with PDZ domain